jgi:hypothetical protein
MSVFQTWRGEERGGWWRRKRRRGAARKKTGARSDVSDGCVPDMDYKAGENRLVIGKN